VPSGERIRIAFTCGVGGLVGCVVEWREGGREGGRGEGGKGGGVTEKRERFGAIFGEMIWGLCAVWWLGSWIL